MSALLGTVSPMLGTGSLGASMCTPWRQQEQRSPFLGPAAASWRRAGDRFAIWPRSSSLVSRQSMVMRWWSRGQLQVRTVHDQRHCRSSNRLQLRSAVLIGESLRPIVVTLNQR